MEKKVLIPILTGKEDNPRFLIPATSGARQVVLVNIIDSNSLSAGDLTNAMQAMEKLMDEMQFSLRKRGISARVYSEWGSLKEKVENIARREDVDEITVFDQGSKTKEKLVELQKITDLPVNTLKGF